jgi:hypothetical protein
MRMLYTRSTSDPARRTDSDGSPRKTWTLLLTAFSLALLASTVCHAQGGVPLVTVATDQSALQVPNQFGVPTFSAINQNGDFAFIGNLASALFFRPAAATSATLLLQIGDQVTGLPGSVIVAFSPVVGLNFGQTILFGVNYNLPDGTAHAAVLTYAASGYSIVATSDDIAPGSGDETYGTSITPGSINDNGDINFIAVPTGKLATTYYIVPSGEAAVRVAALDDTPPATCTWCVSTTGSVGASTDFTYGTSYIPPLTTSGQIPISLSGGLFIGAGDGLQLVQQPSSGPCSSVPVVVGGGIEVPSIGPLIGNQVLLNNAGTIAFLNLTSSGWAICVSTGGGLAVAVANAGGAAPAAVGGTFMNFVLQGVDDSDDILLEAEIYGGTTFDALLRYHLSGTQAGQVDIVAYFGEVVSMPGGSTSAPATVTLGPPSLSIPFPSFTGVSMSNAGLVSFNTMLSPGGDAIFQQAGTATPVLVALSGQTAPSSGGSTLNLTSVPFTETLNNGATFLAAPLANGSAGFGEFLGTPTNLRTLMTTADALPTNARIALTGAAPIAAGNFVAFMAQLPGGGRSLFVSDPSSGLTTRVVSDGNTLTPTVLGLLGTLSIGTSFYVNENGQVAYEVLNGYVSLEIGSGLNSFGTGEDFPVWPPPLQPCGTILLWSPSTGLTQVVSAGDPGPVSGTTFSCGSLNAGQLSSINRSGQIVFNGNLTELSSSNGSPQYFGNGVFAYTPGDAISQLVAVNSSLPGISMPILLVPDIPSPINSSGQVVFGVEAQTAGLGIDNFEGFFMDTAGGTPSVVVANGEPLPGSSEVLSSPNFISGFDDNGDLAFTSSAAPAADGLFLAPSGGSIQTIALDGGAAPGGGTFTLVTPFTVPSGLSQSNHY